MNKCSQRRITRGFSLIIDDSVHRKRGNFKDGVEGKYIGEIGTRDNEIVSSNNTSMMMVVKAYHYI
jgi:SRSO17 transposase